MNSETIGLYAMNSDVMVKNTTFAHFKSGGLIAHGIPRNILYVSDNTFLSCDTTAIYFKGPDTKPIISGNTILFCKLAQDGETKTTKMAAITTDVDVKSKIVGNTLSMNDRGIQCVKNGSYIIDNTIEKTHGNGIFITGSDATLDQLSS
jgi:hypothetical protein